MILNFMKMKEIKIWVLDALGGFNALNAFALGCMALMLMLARADDVRRWRLPEFM